MVNKDNPGSPNKSGAILPKMVHDNIEIIKSNTANATHTINEVFIAIPIPLSSPLILGMNFNKRKDLKTRNVLNDNRIFVA